MTSTDKRLRALAVELLDIQNPDFSAVFTEAGVSSTNAVAFFKKVGAEFELDIAPERYCDFRTLRDLANFIDAQG